MNRFVVFDLDGTLIDSAPDLCVALNRVLSPAGRRDVSVNETRKMTGSGARSLLDRAFDVTGGPLEADEQENAYQQFLARYAEDCCVDTQPYPGVYELLEELLGVSDGVGLCTNKPILHTLTILEKLEMRRYFSEQYGGDSFPSKKPNPEMVIACIKALGGSPAEALLVGDSGADEQAAQATGCGFIGVRYGYGSEELSRDACTVGSVAELRQALGLDGRQ